MNVPLPFSLCKARDSLFTGILEKGGWRTQGVKAESLLKMLQKVILYYFLGDFRRTFPPDAINPPTVFFPKIQINKLPLILKALPV
jgi:hypothetical protein